MEVLTKYYCHGRLSDSFETSLSSTESIGTSKPPLVIGRRPRMILFSVSSRYLPSTKVHLSQILVDAPGLHPVDITNNVFSPLLFQDRTSVKKITQGEDFRMPIQALPDQDQVRIGSLIMDLGKVEEKIAFMLGDHGANRALQMINDTPDYSCLSGLTSAKGFRIRAALMLTTKRKRVQSMLNSNVFLADFMSNIVQLHIKSRTSKTRHILRGLSEGRTFYLVTGHCTYLDPKLSVFDLKASVEALAVTKMQQTACAESKIAALELREFTVPYNPSRFEVGEPKWYILWGPHDPDHELWPPKPIRPTRQSSGRKALTLREIAELSLPPSENPPAALEPMILHRGRRYCKLTWVGIMSLCVKMRRSWLVRVRMEGRARRLQNGQTRSAERCVHGTVFATDIPGRGLENKRYIRQKTLLNAHLASVP